MNQRQISTLRAALLQRREELQRVIDDTTAVFHSQTTFENGNQIDFNHPADMLQADPDYEKELQLIGREREELELVNQALTRQQEGRYGVCGECEEELTFARLQALPYARYCVSCQRDRDAQPGRAS